MAGGCSVRTLLVFLVAAVVLRAYPSKAPQKGLPIPPPGHTAGQDSPIVFKYNEEETDTSGQYL